MHRFRRLAVTALVGMLVLTGCARNTSEALRVGDLSVDNAQVEVTAAPFAENLVEAGVSDATGQVRQSVVQLTVFNEVAGRYAEEHRITVDAPDLGAAAEALQLDEDDAYVRLRAEASALLAALSEDAEPRTPTEDEMRGVYDRYLSVAGPDTGATFEQIRDELLGLEEYGKALKIRDELTDAAGRYGVTVNPRYQPLNEFPLLAVADGQLLLVGLPLGEQGTGATRPES